MKTEYIITKNTMQRLYSRHSRRMEKIAIRDNQTSKKNSILCCKYCGESLTVGDRIISFGRTVHSKRYHYKCAERVNIV